MRACFKNDLLPPAVAVDGGVGFAQSSAKLREEAEVLKLSTCIESKIQFGSVNQLSNAALFEWYRRQRRQCRLLAASLRASLNNSALADDNYIIYRASLTVLKRLTSRGLVFVAAAASAARARERVRVFSPAVVDVAAAWGCLIRGSESPDSIELLREEGEEEDAIGSKRISGSRWKQEN